MSIAFLPINPYFYSMRYIVEIDDQTDKGAQLISYIEKLRPSKKAVTIHKEQPLTDEEMVLPGPKPSKERLEEWLEPKDDEEEMPLKEAIEEIRRDLKSKYAKSSK
jgi:hypothetical protein